MIYQVIQPPFTLKFRQMNKSELKSYYAWFMDQMPKRIHILENFVRSSANFSSWSADKQATSLDPLGIWFTQNVSVRQRTQEEFDQLRQDLPYHIDIPTSELSNQTFSLAMDIGMYFAEVFLNAFHMLRWKQNLTAKTFVDYGQPIIGDFGKVTMNPVRLMIVQAYSVSNGTGPAKIKELYDIWAKTVPK